MSLHRSIDGSDPIRPERIGRLDQRTERRVTGRLATGTIACPSCDAPVLLAAGPVSPAAPLGCPYCDHRAAVRDFLSLSAPARPARAEVRVVSRRRRVGVAGSADAPRQPL